MLEIIINAADDVHSLAGNGSSRINLFHKEDKDPLPSSLVLLRDCMYFLSKYIYIQVVLVTSN